ncbi:hypothetical protein GGR75_002975 [Xanthomonas campestris]|nr:hypothetical protein [Xanthomonas campestris]
MHVNQVVRVGSGIAVGLAMQPRLPGEMRETPTHQRSFSAAFGWIATLRNAGLPIRCHGAGTAAET